MPPIRHKDTPDLRDSFFTPRPHRNNVIQHDYKNIERNEINPENPRPNRPATARLAPAPAPADNSPPPGAPDYTDSDDENATITVDIPIPAFADIVMNEEERMAAILKWTADKNKHTKKKKEKNSHVYWYMHREMLEGQFYPEYKGGPKILQEFKWHCKKCVAPGGGLKAPYVVLESNRRGVTSGMDKHLKSHGITKDIHFARLHGYSGGIGSGEYTELDAWSGKPMPRTRLTRKQAVRRWFVETRQPFSIVEDDAFQEMFLAHGTQCVYKNRVTLRNHIYDDFLDRRAKLKYELDINCISISFTLDMWTSPNRKPILAIIGHWMTPEFEEREEVLEFIEITGEHSGEQLADVVEKLLGELMLKHKLFSITGDNAGNNGTMCDSLFDRLKDQYDDKPSLVRPRMRFHGRDSFVRCLAHVINLICSDVLRDLKDGTAKEAKKLMDDWEKRYNSNEYHIPLDNSRSSVAKVRLINLWILRSNQREQAWSKLPRAANRRPIYDCDTRWNSCYDMIMQFLELLPEYLEFCRSHPQIKCLLPTDNEILALTQLAYVLEPFKKQTLKVSEDMPSLSRSLEIYWDLDDLLERVISGEGIYSELDQSICKAFKAGKAKHVKYLEEMEKCTIIYAAHILDPRCKTSLIKDMMGDQTDRIVTAVTDYFKAEWPETVATGSASTSWQSSAALPDTRPADISIARWKQLQSKMAQDVQASIAPLTSELERWLASKPEEWQTSPDFVRMWWKEHASQWPELAVAARDLLPVSASEVDVERLFSGCRDEIGIRRHSLKAETVRVLTLLRSAYASEDEVDKALIKAAMKLDIVFQRNSILWRPDNIEGHLLNGEFFTLINTLC